MRCCNPDISLAPTSERIDLMHSTLTKFLNKSTNCIAMRYRVFLGISQQITPALNRCIYCLLKKKYSTRKTQPSIERTVVSKNWIKQLHTLPVLHFNRCLTTEYSEITAHLNGNFDTDNQMYVP
jgi:hypothetical protein